MSDSYQTPAIKKAFSYLSELLNSHHIQANSRIPSIVQLAIQACVSRNSMWKAIQKAKEDRLISVTRGGYIIAGSINSAGMLAVQSQSRKETWRKTRAALEHDMAQGIFGINGNLPHIKDLLARYGVCYRTMQKALQAMAQDGLIRHNHKKYSLPGIAGVSYQPQIVFITCTGHFAQMSALNQEQNRIINLFESECRRMGLRSEIIEIDFYSAAESRAAMLKLERAPAIIGYVFDLWWYDSDIFQRNCIDVLAKLASLRLPVAILDEVGGFNLPIHHQINPLLQVYSIERKRAGERVARYLQALGHRTAVFISSLHHAQWSVDRYEGVRAQFAAQGDQNNLHLIAIPASVPRPDGALSLLAASGLADADVRRLIASGRTPSQAKDMERMWDDFIRADSLKKAGAHVYDPSLRKNLAGLSSIMHQDFDRDFLQRTTQAVIMAAAIRAFALELKPLFEKALVISDVTAWICANDLTAFDALSFLRSKKIRVPKDLSVVGFDNVPIRSLEHRLTTLDFNAMGFVHQMINFVVRPPRPRGPYRHSVIEVEGIIMDRETTGRVDVKIRER